MKLLIVNFSFKKSYFSLLSYLHLKKLKLDPQIKTCVVLSYVFEKSYLNQCV